MSVLGAITGLGFKPARRGPVTIAQDLNFSVATSLCEGEATLRVHGEVDVATSPAPWEALTEVIGHRPSRVVLDLADAGLFDCSGVGVVARCLHVLPGEATPVVLRFPNPLTRKVCELTRRDQQCTLEA